MRGMVHDRQQFCQHPVLSHLLQGDKLSVSNCIYILILILAKIHQYHFIALGLTLHETEERNQ